MRSPFSVALSLTINLEMVGSVKYVYNLVKQLNCRKKIKSVQERKELVSLFWSVF